MRPSFILSRSGKMTLAVGISVLGALLQGCGSDNATAPAGPMAVGGNVNKGPIDGAAVTIHGLQVDGSPAAPAAGPFTTDGLGDWAGQIPAGQTGPYVLAATGGSYLDEASGTTVTLAPGMVLHGLLEGTSSQVTPLTHATFVGMQHLVSGGATLASAIAQATSSSVTAFGFDFATTVPRNTASATEAEKKYAALLGGVSELLHDNPALSAFTNTHPMDLVLVLAADMADGKLDGLDPSGTPIEVPTSGNRIAEAPMPGLSPNDLSAWLDAANTFAGTQPNLNGIGFNLSTAWNPSTAASTGTCEVDFSNTGLSLLDSDCFTTTFRETFEEQFTFTDGLRDVQILVIPVNPASNAVRTIYVTRPEHGTAVWNKFNGAGIPGVTRSGGRVTFVNVTLEELTGTTLLTLNGQLEEPN